MNATEVSTEVMRTAVNTQLAAEGESLRYDDLPPATRSAIYSAVINRDYTDIEVPEDTLEAIRQEIEAAITPQLIPCPGCGGNGTRPPVCFRCQGMGYVHMATEAQVAQPAPVPVPSGLLLTVDAKNLQDALKYVKGSIANKTTLPVLNNVLLSTLDRSGKLEIAGTNLEVGMVKRIPAEVTGLGMITLPFRLLLDSVGKKGQVTISLDEKTRTVTLTSELNGKKVTTDIKGISAEEFPCFPELDTPPLAMLDMAALQTAIRQTAFCASDDDSRPVLAGLYMELYPNGSFVMAAADGFRLGKYDTGNHTGEPTKLIIPAKSMLEVLKMSGEVAEVIITPGKNQVAFRNECDEEVTSRLVEGNYVDIQRVIPVDWTTRMVLTTAELKDCISLVMPFAKDSGYIVRFNVEPSTIDLTPALLQVSANAAEAGSRVVNQDCNMDGDANQVALNGKFMLDILGAIDSALVAVEWKTYQSPVVFKPVGNANVLWICMPMYLPNR